MYVPPFTVSAKAINLISEISRLIERYAIRLEQEGGLLLRKANRIKTIHSSLAIEGNTLSEDNVRDIIDEKTVIAPIKQIQEVKNAIATYELYQKLNPFSVKDLLKAHGVMMQALVDNPGRFRSSGVGVFSEKGLVHMAPPPDRVPMLINDLFSWLKSSKDHLLIRSCVFHYEFEFIHPFMDGNGRMGRYWQTMLLARWKGIFAWIPVETIVKAHQQDYYNAIAVSDANGECTSFISFMLKCLLDSICEFDVTYKVTYKVAERPLSDNENKILNLISKNNYITIGEISVKTRLSDSGIRKIISLLKKKGIITRLGSRKNGHWVVNR